MFERFFSVKFMLSVIPTILSHLPTTLYLALAASFAGWVIGFFTALIRIHKIPVLNTLAGFYISVIRGIPLMVQLYLTYYGIPVLQACLNILVGRPDAPVYTFQAITFALIALALNCGAYSSETFRATIQAVDRGQIEAAYSVGLTGIQTMKRITLPQALVIAVPTLNNSLISYIHGTSLVFSVGVIEIMAGAKLVGGRGYRYLEPFLIVGLIYWVVCIATERFTAWVEKKLKIPGHDTP
jgi:His/Glu/Gln/Arg/opine family amino acid ABC transporter permease subunit